MSVSGSASQEEFFRSLNADDNEVTEMESLCVHCMEQVSRSPSRHLIFLIHLLQNLIPSIYTCSHAIQ